MTRKKQGLLFLIFLFGALWCWCEQTVPKNWYRNFYHFKSVTNYSPSTYRAGNQNWAICQDTRGILYVGNQTGLLIFDGVSWSFINIPNKTVRSIDIDNTGTIYIGGQKEIGYLKANNSGVLTYISLMPQLEKKQRIFTEVFQTHCSTQGVWFKTTDKLFRWYNGKFKVWDQTTSKDKYKTVFSWKDKCYAQQGNQGLLVVAGDSLQKVPASEPFSKERIIMALPFNENTLLLGTREKGWFLFDGTTINPFPTEADTYLRENMFSCCTRLTNGDFAAATLAGGLVILSPQGQLKIIYSRETSGLLDNNVKYVMEDTQGNLWLALNNGIARIDYNAPYSLFTEKQGLHGQVLSVLHHHDKLYVGTSDGLFFLEPAAPGIPDSFLPVTGVTGSTWSLLSVEDYVLVAVAGRVLQLDSKNLVSEVVANANPFVLSTSQFLPGRVWIANDNNLQMLRWEKKGWTIEKEIDCQQPGIRSLAEDKNGHIWLGTITNGVIKIENATQPTNTNVRLYGENNGLPKGEIFVAPLTDHIVFATTGGLYKLETNSNHFIPDTILGKNFCDGSRHIFRLVEDKNQDIWFHSEFENFFAQPTKPAGFSIQTVVFPIIADTQVNTIYPDKEKIWFAVSDGLVCYEKQHYRKENTSFSALVRKVTSIGEELYYGGYKTDTGTPVPVIKHKNRNLRFDVAAPFFEGNTVVNFRFFLKGLDDTWSPWTTATYQNYTNLDGGTYTFHVQARDGYGHLSKEDNFTFKILPPWYLTWWAYVLYALAAFYFVFLLIKWRSAQLIKEKKQLERVVEERTHEINAANQELQHQSQLLLEQSEQLKEMDKAKSRFFANISHEFRTPLSLIMGPLDHLRAQTSDETAIKQMNLAYRNSQRLLSLINQLLDLAKLESGKMTLQAELRDLPVFLKALLEGFQLPAQRQQVELLFSTPKDSILLYFDVEKMEKIMLNLLSNALKFTPAGGKITVSIIELSPYVDIRVADTGPGIPSEQLEHIFDRFFQGTPTKEHRQKGSGIGLSLTKELVELHQGEIFVTSNSSGSVFTVRLPLGSEHLVPSEKLNTADVNHTETAVQMTGDNRQLTVTNSLWPMNTNFQELDNGEDTTENKTTNENKDIILVVEDNQDLRRYIRSCLSDAYMVEEARDGREGLEKAKSIVPDLIISDIMMPEIDGYELLRTIKSDIATSHIPVVLLTAKTSEASILQGLERGADDYITKPFNTRVLCARVKNLIELRRQLQQNLNREMIMQPSQMHISKIDGEFLAEVQHVIEKNLSEPDFNVEDLSRRLSMSRTTVYRKILALCGETPTDYIRSYRLKRAAQLFKANFGSVTEVAFEVGFTSRAYFTKCFKDKFHRLPSEFPASFDVAG